MTGSCRNRVCVKKGLTCSSFQPTKMERCQNTVSTQSKSDSNQSEESSREATFYVNGIDTAESDGPVTEENDEGSSYHLQKVPAMTTSKQTP